MGNYLTSISSSELCELVGGYSCPALFDVRRAAIYAEAKDRLPTATWRDHRLAGTWGKAIPAGRPVVVYCVHGHEVSQSAAALLRSAGIDARYLEGGIEAYRELGAPLIDKVGMPQGITDAPSRWVTRERPKIDRIACPWFIRRFVDSDAVIHFVSPDLVIEAAAELDATPFDIPDTAFSHVGEFCSFDAFLSRFGMADPAMARLAEIVRGADTGRLDLAPQAAGLLAVSSGLSAIESDDLAMLEMGLVVYDALYGWCRFVDGESHRRPTGQSHGNSVAKAQR